MEFKCYLCSHIFTQKHNLVKHLSEKKCKGDLLNDWLKLNEILANTSLREPKASCIKIVNNAPVHQDNSVHINVQININPITKLSLDHIEPIVMRELVKDYDKDSSKLNLLLSDYMKSILCDHSHPENHSVKYIKKKPPTFNALIEDKEGNISNVIKGLSDTCELLSDC